MPAGGRSRGAGRREVPSRADLETAEGLRAANSRSFNALSRSPRSRHNTEVCLFLAQKILLEPHEVVAEGVTGTERKKRQSCSFFFFFNFACFILLIL